MDDSAHYDGLTFWGPLSAATLDPLIELMPLLPGARVLDVGCGRGETLARLVERYRVRGIGLDASPHALARARDNFDQRIPDQHVELVELAVDIFTPRAPCDAIVWLGGPFIGGTIEHTLVTFAEWLHPGGWLLMGSGFWKAPPPVEYREMTGIPQSELRTDWGNVEAAQKAGFRLMANAASTRADWDRFESRILYNVQRAGGSERHERFHEAQLRWGRDCMGFGLYLLRKPPPAG